MQTEGSTHHSPELTNFIDDVKRCRGDFQWIREKNEIITEQRNKRQTTRDLFPISNPTSNIEVEDDGGDLWYNNFRRSECDGNNLLNHCKRYPVRHNKEVDLKDWHFENEAPSGSQTGESFDLEDIQYSDEDDIRIDRDLSDQESPKQNDLSHEANYKLSKFEQEHQFANQSISHSRRKRSLPNPARKSQGRPIAILASDPIDRSKSKTKKQVNDIYDEEIVFPEPMLAEQVLSNMGIKSVKKWKQSELAKINQTEVLDDEDLLQMLSTEKSTAPKKNQIGITLEVKVNNVTKQKFESITQLRRRKKSVATEKDRSKNSYENNIPIQNVPNEVVNAVFELVKNNEMLKNHIGPLLDLKHNLKYENQPMKVSFF